MLLPPLHTHIHTLAVTSACPVPQGVERHACVRARTHAPPPSHTHHAHMLVGTALQVTGTIPKELRGTYMRNGPGLQVCSFCAGSGGQANKGAQDLRTQELRAAAVWLFPGSCKCTANPFIGPFINMLTTSCPGWQQPLPEALPGWGRLCHLPCLPGGGCASALHQQICAHQRICG